MSSRKPTTVHVTPCDGPDPRGIWRISSDATKPHPVAAPRVVDLASHVFTILPEAMSVSIVACAATIDGWTRAQAPCGSDWFFNGRVADLVGFATEDAARDIHQSDVDRWISEANARGLAHIWVEDGAVVERRETSFAAPNRTETTRRLSVGIDAAWLLAGESGAQVFVFEMLLALIARDEIERVVLLSDGGRVPARLQGRDKIEGMAWSDALAMREPCVDVLHRPYQPDDDVDFERYRRVGRTVALTVLDFIAYDISTYHESARAWRRHRARFDEQVLLADGIFAISQCVADRVNDQYDGRLARPARATSLGADHLLGMTSEPTPSTRMRDLVDAPFLVVLGNDFAHKNRDFAVKAFAMLCDRGYTGRLVLAGFHLDLGSSYAYELSGAGAHQARIVRFGSVTSEERNWLLARADVVLYPTSAEGFGLIPFEAAAMGTPTAFVRFGPLVETMPSADASDGWRLLPFAELIERLCRDPEQQVARINGDARRLTWQRHAAQMIDEYRELVAAADVRRRRPLPGPPQRAWRTMSHFVERLTAAVERRARRAFPLQSA